MRFNGFEDVICIKEYSINKREGEHGCCRFSALVDDTKGEALLSKLGTELLAFAEMGGALAFRGEITKIALKKSYSSVTLSVEACSHSQAMDVEKRQRIFQSPKKTTDDILKEIKPQAKCKASINEAVKEIPLSPVILQKEETDFAFLCRLSKMIGTSLWVMDAFSPTEVIVGDVIDDEIRMILEENILSLETTRYTVGELLYLHAVTCLNIGQKVRIGKETKIYVVMSMDAMLCQGSDEFCYSLRELVTPQTKAMFPLYTEQLPVKLKAEVQNTDDPEHKGRIQVGFSKPVEDIHGNDPLWIPYRSPYCGKKGGIVFLPDKGDEVEVFFTEGDCYAISALRTVPLPAECQKVVEKYIGNNSEQRIFLREKSLELHSEKNVIVMDKDKIKLVIGDRETHVTLDKDKIELVVGRSRLLITQEGIALNTKESSAHFSQDIALKSTGVLEAKSSKDINLHADGNLLLKCNAAELEGSSDVAVKSGATLTLKGSSKVNIC